MYVVASKGAALKKWYVKVVLRTYVLVVGKIHAGKRRGG